MKQIISSYRVWHIQQHQPCHHAIRPSPERKEHCCIFVYRLKCFSLFQNCFSFTYSHFSSGNRASIQYIYVVRCCYEKPRLMRWLEDYFTMTTLWRVSDETERKITLTTTCQNDPAARSGKHQACYWLRRRQRLLLLFYQSEIKSINSQFSNLVS